MWRSARCVHLVKKHIGPSFAQLLSCGGYAKPCRLSVAQFYLAYSVPLLSSEILTNIFLLLRSACINDGRVSKACASMCVRVCLCTVHTRAHIGRLYQVVQTIREEPKRAVLPHSTPHAVTVPLTYPFMRAATALRLCLPSIYTRAGVRSVSRFCQIFLGISTGWWAVLQLLCCQARNEFQEELLKQNKQNLSDRPNAGRCTVLLTRDNND